MAIDNINELDKLNTGRIKLNQAIDQANTIQGQLDTIVLESGTSDAEVIQARGGEPLLYNRLNKVDVELAQAVYQLKSAWIDVKADFGAKGDGITDDTIAIQNAINSITIEKRTVFFPMGIYNISEPLTVNSNQITIEGASKDSTTINIIGASNGINLNGGEKITIRDISISGNTATLYGLDSLSGFGIYCNGARQVHLEKVWFKYLGNNALHLEGGCWIYNIINCDFDSIKGDAINGLTIDGNQQKNAINIQGCSIGKCNDNGINVWGININILNNTIQSTNGSGVMLSSDEVTNYTARNINIRGNYFEVCKGGCVYIKATNIGNIRQLHALTIQNNYFGMNVSHANSGVLALVRFNGDLNATSSPRVRYVTIKDNYYNSDTLAYVDCYYQLGTDSTINETKALNDNLLEIGLVKFINNSKEIVLQGYFYAKGVNYSNIEKSDDITTQTDVYFPVTLPQNSQYISMGIYVDTDYADFRIKFTLMKRSKKGVGSYTNVVGSTITANTSGYMESPKVTSISMSAVDNARFIKDDTDYIVNLTVYPDTPGTYLRLGNLCVVYN